MLTSAGTTTPTRRRRDGGRDGNVSVLLLFDSPLEARNSLFLVHQRGSVPGKRAMLLVRSHELLLLLLLVFSVLESRNR